MKGGSWYSEYFGSSFRTELTLSGSGLRSQKLPVRRHMKWDNESYEVASNVFADLSTPIAGNTSLPTGESPPCLNWDVSSNIEEDFVFNTDGLNYEKMEFEPHSYFSFNDLLPDNDGAHLDRVDPLGNLIERI